MYIYIYIYIYICIYIYIYMHNALFILIKLLTSACIARKY